MYGLGISKEGNILDAGVTADIVKKKQDLGIVMVNID